MRLLTPNRINQDSTNLWPYWTNNTCNPSSSTQNSICGLSFVPEYTIVAKTKEHIQAGVNFARTNNLRLIIRNTGHDFMGRSTGYGALAINTHNFKDMTWIKAYTGPGNWTGGAVTIGAGMQTADLYKLAYNQNPKVVVVGGECAVSVHISRSLEFCDRLADVCKDCGIGWRIYPRRRPWPTGLVFWHG